MSNLQNKPIIEIWDSVGLGIIIEYPTGVWVSQQTGGTSCLHPKVEGIYLPLHNDYTHKEHQFLSPEIDLSQYFEGPKHNGTGATSGLDQEDVKVITEILTKYKLGHILEINKSKLKESHEAWVHIWLKPEKNNIPLWTGFEPYPRNAILTWCNSD